MLDLNLLKTFTVIAETGSLSRSASRIGLTQAAVSLQVKRLERLLNQQLLERTGRGVTLTRNGSRLLEHAERILRYHDEALAELKMALSLPGGFPGADRAAQMLASSKIED